MPDNTPAVCGCWTDWMQANLSSTDQATIAASVQQSGSVVPLTDISLLGELTTAQQSCDLGQTPAPVAPGAPQAQASVPTETTGVGTAATTITPPTSPSAGSSSSPSPSATAPAATNTAACARPYPSAAPENGQRRMVVVQARQRLTCSEAASIGNDVANLYYSSPGIPVASYPPLPQGVPGGKGQPFTVSTALGGFTCYMQGRGSDFVAATCTRGNQSVRFGTENH